MHILREQGAEFGHLGSVSLVLNITQTHFVHRVGAEFGHLGSVFHCSTLLRLTLYIVPPAHKFLFKFAIAQQG